MKNLKQEEKLLIEYVEQLDEEKVVEWADKLLDKGMGPLYLLDLVNEGMNRVGKLYESKDYYIADLIMAGLIFRQVLQLDKMVAHFHSSHAEKIGKLLLGTVSGDIHDIGKDIFRGMMEANGFEVVDLGVDVPSESFLRKYQEYKPDIIGLSGVLTSTVNAMQEIVELFVNTGLRDEVKIIAGGNHLTPEVCKYIGTDAFANDASDGVKICTDWINSTNGQGVIDNG